MKSKPKAKNTNAGDTTKLLLVTYRSHILSKGVHIATWKLLFQRRFEHVRVYEEKRRGAPNAADFRTSGW